LAYDPRLIIPAGVTRGVARAHSRPAPPADVRTGPRRCPDSDGIWDVTLVPRPPVCPVGPRAVPVCDTLRRVMTRGMRRPGWGRRPTVAKPCRRSALAVSQNKVCSRGCLSARPHMRLIGGGIWRICRCSTAAPPVGHRCRSPRGPASAAHRRALSRPAGSSGGEDHRPTVASGAGRWRRPGLQVGQREMSVNSSRIDGALAAGREGVWRWPPRRAVRAHMHGTCGGPVRNAGEPSNVRRHMTLPADGSVRTPCGAAIRRMAARGAATARRKRSSCWAHARPRA
jgi:hypothetical protein